MISLAGKSVLITGAAKRLGKATAHALAADGANIVLHYATSKSEAEDLAHEIEAQGVKAWTLQGDLSNPHHAAKLFGQAQASAGTIELLVNNASAFPESTFSNFTADEVHANIDLHALSPAFLARAMHAPACRRGPNRHR